MKLWNNKGLSTVELIIVVVAIVIICLFLFGGRF